MNSASCLIAGSAPRQARASAQARLEAIKKVALELKAKAEADAAAAKWIKDDLMRRFKPVTGAA